MGCLSNEQGVHQVRLQLQAQVHGRLSVIPAPLLSTVVGLVFRALVTVRMAQPRRKVRVLTRHAPRQWRRLCCSCSCRTMPDGLLGSHEVTKAVVTDCNAPIARVSSSDNQHQEPPWTTRANDNTVRNTMLQVDDKGTFSFGMHNRNNPPCAVILNDSLISDLHIQIFNNGPFFMPREQGYPAGSTTVGTPQAPRQHHREYLPRLPAHTQTG